MASTTGRMCDSCDRVTPPEEIALAQGWWLDDVLTHTDDGRTVAMAETRCPACW